MAAEPVDDDNMNLLPGGGIHLERRVGGFGTIDIVERPSDGARLYLQNAQLQSLARPDGASLLAYNQAIRGVLLQVGCRRVAILGAAGSTLGTMLARDGATPVLVDINPDAFELAEKYFWLAPTVERVVADAHDFLSRGTELFDAIVLDTFDGGETPPHLMTVGFFGLARRRLLPQGLLLLNVPAHRGQPPRTVGPATLMVVAGFPVTVLEGPTQICRNALVIGGPLPDVALPVGDEPAETIRDLSNLRVTRRTGT